MKTKTLTTKREALVHFFQLMDIEMIALLLNDAPTYQDFPKEVFIEKLSRTFDEFKEKGDTFLNAIQGTCGICDKSKNGFMFIGNASKQYMSIIFDMEGNVAKDVFECAKMKVGFSDVDRSNQLWIQPIDLDMPF
ncbi:MAG: hypothetical protein FJX80_09505 [Bacteroidetes bacterium]|nr:hypothetical protein [Bacteroidota bacterium]